MRLSHPSAGARSTGCFGAGWLSTNANDSPLCLRAAARLAPTNPPPMITTSNFMRRIITRRQVSFIIPPPSRKNPLADKQDAHRSLSTEKQSHRCPYGMGDGSPFPHVVQTHGSGHGGERDGIFQFAVVRFGKDQATRQP